jgi:hypothetical protein
VALLAEMLHGDASAEEQEASAAVLRNIVQVAAFSMLCVGLCCGYYKV